MANLFQIGATAAPPNALGTTVPAPSAITGTYNPAFGGIPSVPNPVSNTGDVITGDTSQLPSVGALTTGTATANATGAAAQYQQNLPQYNDLIGTSSSDILSNLHGVLPPDVMNLISQQGAERGVATGSPESPNSDAAFLQSLGLTSLGLENTGETQLNSAIGRTPTGPQVNAQAYQTTPAQQQNASQLQSELLAAPIPADAAAANSAAAAAGRAAGSGAVTSPTNPSLPAGTTQPAGSSPLYQGQQTPQNAGYPPIGEVPGSLVGQLISLGYSQQDIENMSAEDAASLTNTGVAYDPNASTYYGNDALATSVYNAAADDGSEE